jgi:hypothetical protein
MAKPLSLTAEQEGQIEQASFALPDREAFRVRVLEELAGQVEIGDGAVYRACARVQRTLWIPPLTPSEAHRAQQLRKLS